MTEKPRAADPGATGSAPGGSAATGADGDRSGERVVIRDRRRIDPTGGGRAGERAGAADAAAADGTDGADGAPAGGSHDPAAQRGDGSSPDEAGHASGARHRREENSGAADAEASEDDTERAGEPAAEQSPAGGDPADEPDSPVVDEQELAQVLTENQPDSVPPVVDEPTSPVGGGQAEESSGPLGAELEALRAELDERTSDLQRVSAEYANYRKRVDRDRGLVADQAIGTVLSALLPILDDLDRARGHGDLVGPFGTVAEQLTAAVGKFGLTAFGEKGDPFDPTRHEAVAHQTSAEVSEPTCVDVMRRGYLLGERLLRPALVAVADPE